MTITLSSDRIRVVRESLTKWESQQKRVWEPTPDDPALIIIVDEWAELPDEARAFADSIARRGRAVAENLIAATQRPTQEAMGKGTAVRSQMDIRICVPATLIFIRTYGRAWQRCAEWVHLGTSS